MFIVIFDFLFKLFLSSFEEINVGIRQYIHRMTSQSLMIMQLTMNNV